MSRGASVFLDLYLMQLSNYRWTWRWQLIGGLIAPLSFMFMLRSLQGDAGRTAEAGAYILAGNLVLSALFTALGQTANRFAWLKETEGLDYYATLPIGRGAMVVSVVLAFVTLSLPSIGATVVLGRLLFGIPLAPHPLALAVIVLTAMCLAAAGAAIGVLAPDTATQDVVSNLVLFFLLFLSPVLVPAERLPALLQLTSRLLPVSYAVEALRSLLLGRVDETVLRDLALLTLFAAGAIAFVAGRLDWRRR